MLSGNNGILTRAGEAKEETNKANIREKVQLEILASYSTTSGLLDKDLLVENLENIGGTVTRNNYPIEVTIENKQVTITEQGEVILEDEMLTDSELKEKISVWTGDSLMAGVGNAKGGFGNYYREAIGADTSKVGQIAQGGSTISNNTPQTESKPYPIIRNQIDYMKEHEDVFKDTSIICMDGGGNDVMMYALNLLDSSYKKEIGQVDNSITTPTTGNTVIADFEEILNKIKTEFPNTKVLYVQPFDYSREKIEDIVFAYVTAYATTVTEVNNNLNTRFPTANANFSTMDEARTWINTNFNTQITEMVNRGNQLFAEIPKALKKFGYDYMDLTQYIGANTNSYYQSDKVHFTDLTYTTMIPSIINKMKIILK